MKKEKPIQSRRSPAPRSSASAPASAPAPNPKPAPAAAPAAELPLGEYAAYLGLDWGDEKHAIALDPRGALPVETLELPHSAEALHAWLDALRVRFGGQPVAVAVEASRLRRWWSLRSPAHAKMTLWPSTSV